MPAFKTGQAVLAGVLAVMLVVLTGAAGASRLWWLAVPLVAVAAGFIRPWRPEDDDDDLL